MRLSEDTSDTPKPPKKKKKVTTSTSTSSTTTSSPYYYPPSSSTPPTYSQPKKPKRPKKPKPDYIDSTLDNGISALFQNLSRGKGPDQKVNPVQDPVGKPPIPDFWKPPSQRSDLTSPVDDKMSSLQEILRAVNKDPKQFPGVALGDEKLDLKDHPLIRAWVPEKWRHVGRDLDKPLKEQWDEDRIRKDIVLGAMYDSQVEQNLTEIIKQQYATRMAYLRKKEIWGPYRQAANTLEEAQESFYDKDDPNFGVVTEAMRENPELFDLPRYNEQFGITPKMIWDQAKKDAAHYADDPYMQSAIYYRARMRKKHYRYLRDQYRKARTLLEDKMGDFEDEYADSLKYQKDQGNDVSNIPKEAFPDLTPPTDPNDQAILDKAGRDANPFIPENQATALTNLMGIDLGNADDKVDRKVEAENRETRQRIRESIKEQLGVKKLPTIRQMLAIKVAEGNLDPDNEEEIKTWIDRFKNPMHWDTRAMYMGFAMDENDEITEDEALAFVNAPFERWTKRQEKQAKRDAEDAAKEKEKDDEGFQWGDLNDFDDHIGSIGLKGYTNNTDDPLIQFESLPGGGIDVNIAEPLAWTFDQISRPLYSVAAANDALFALDKDDPKKARDWTDALAFIPGPQMALSAFSYGLTGKSWTDSIDELVSNPVDSINQVLGAAGDQFNRNQGPGKGDEIVPMTFSQVIANQALRDPEGNLYDKSWFQHTAGFAMDVGMDPLNLVGIGVIDDTIKLPIRVVKKLAEESGVSVATAQQVLQRMYSRRIGTRANMAEEVKQLVSDSPINHPLISDDKLYADHLAEGQLKEAELNKHIDDINVQIAAQSEAAGLAQFRARRAELEEAMGANLTRPAVDIRMSKVIARNNIPIAGTTYRNYGGRFWRDLMDPLELEARRGYGSPRYTTEPMSDDLTPVAQEAKYAQDQLDAYYKTTDLPDPAIVAGLEAKITRALETDPIRGVPNLTYDANVERYLADLRAQGKVYKPKNGFDPGKVLAEAGGISKKELMERLGASEYDFIMSFVKGHSMLMDDPKMVERLKTAVGRVRDSKRTIASLEGRTDEAASQMRRDAYKAMSYGYTMQSEMTIAGAMRYLDELQKLRIGARDGWINKPLAKHLNRQLIRINKELEAAGIDSLDTNVYSRAFEDYDFSDGASYNEAIEAVMTKEVRNDFTGEVKPAFEDRTRALVALRKEILTQLEDLKVARTPEVTGFTPGQVHQLDQMLPKDSQFRNPDGSFNSEAIKKVFDEPSPDDKQVYKHEYHIENGTPQDYEFIAILNDTLRGEYRGAYQGKKSEKLFGDPEIIPQVEEFKQTGHTENPVVSMRGSTEKPVFNKGVPDTSVVVRKKPPTKKPETHKVWGPRTEKMRPRPTADSFREQSPKFTAEAMKSDGLKQAHAFEFDKNADSTFGQTALDETPTGIVSSTYTQKTKNQEGWEKHLENQQREWDKQYADNRAADILEKQGDPAQHKLSVKEAEQVTKSAWNETINGVLDSLKQRGTVEWTPSNARLRIDAEYADARKQARLEAEYEKTQIRIRHLEADKPDLKAMYQELKLAESKLAQVQKDLAKSREEAIATRREAIKRADEEALLQFLTALPKLSGNMIQLRLMGIKKNLQFTNSLGMGAAQAAKFLPATVMGNHVNFFVRPTRLLAERESIHIRAMWESMTPVVIQAHLTRLSDAMRHLTESERFAMLRAFRKGRDYEGTNSQLFDGVQRELVELEDIFNGRHDFYYHKNADGKAIPLKLHEIKRFLPQEYQFDTDVMFNLMKRRVKEGGRKPATPKPGIPFSGKPTSTTNYTVDDFMQAVNEYTGGSPKDMGDPFRLAWVVRMAADQAIQLKAVYNDIEKTFGVRIPKTGDPRRAMTSRLIAKHGWKAHKELDQYVIFPPQVHKEVEQLLKFTQPGKEQARLMRLIDTTIGYWKQGMTIYNPGYYTRNGVGEIMSSWLDGVNHPKWYRYAQQVLRFEKGEDTDLAALLSKWKVEEGVTRVTPGSKVLFPLKGGYKVTAEDVLEWYVKTGMKSTFANTDIDRGLRGLAGSSLTDSKLAKGYKAQNEYVHGKGEGFEDYLRLAHFMHAMENSGKGTLKAAAEHAAERVTKYHFDYTDFSEFEKMVMLRAFPFYKWIRRGAPLMMAHLFMTPGKMTALPKAMDMFSNLGLEPLNALPGGDPLFSTQDVHEDKNGFLPNYDHIAPAWVRDLFAYQTAPADDDEYANYFRMQTPQIDGLNAALNMLPSEDKDGVGAWFGDTAGYPLLNPLLKTAAELGPGFKDGEFTWSRNEGLDPDFPFPIVSGEYNENMGINPVEAVVGYAAKQLSPWTAFFGKLSKNNDLPGPLGFGDKDTDRSAIRDWVSQLTGVGFYQAWNGETSSDGEKVLPEDLLKNTPVGPKGINEILSIVGEAAAQGPLPKAERVKAKKLLDEISRTVGTAMAEGKGSEWKDFPDFKWRNFGNNNYGSGYSSYGSGYSSSSGGTDFWDLIQKLKELIDQGDVVE